MKKTAFILLPLLTFCGLQNERMSVAPAKAQTSAQVADKISYKDKAQRIYKNIIRLYSVPESDLFRESYPKQADDPEYAYFWPHTGLFGAAMQLQALGYNDDSIQKVTDGMNEYWDASREPPGFQSTPTKTGRSDRFYDDNAVAGLALLNAYRITDKQLYLDRAQRCYFFVASGESPELGGGLYWNESHRGEGEANEHPSNIKAANVTALSANLALKMYQVKGDAAYLDAAKRWYAWTRDKLQDPEDKIYWNDLALKDGVVNRTKWAYNSGAMITNACLLYSITQDAHYLQDARELAQQSYKYFTREVPGKGRFFPPNDPWFTMILLRGYLDLYALDKNPQYINTLIQNVDYAWENARNANGLFYEDWSGEKPGRYYSLLTQEAMVEIYALLAQFKNQ